MVFRQESLDICRCQCPQVLMCESGGHPIRDEALSSDERLCAPVARDREGERERRDPLPARYVIFDSRPSDTFPCVVTVHCDFDRKLDSDLRTGRG